ncbi:MAG: hypothetical protein K2X93_00025 [Candidatus Obscuribacterales bacterium]|nr:hypothetical protein [Candidatus Obscuribacterales bacterium]
MTNQKGIDAQQKADSSADESYLDFDMDADRTPGNPTPKDSKKDSDTGSTTTSNNDGTAGGDSLTEDWAGADSDTEGGDGSDPLGRESVDLYDSGTALLNKLKSVLTTPSGAADLEAFFDFGAHGSPFAEVKVAFHDGGDSDDPNIGAEDPIKETSPVGAGADRAAKPEGEDDTDNEMLAHLTGAQDDFPEEGDERGGNPTEKPTKETEKPKDDNSDIQLLGAGVLAAGGLAALFARRDSKPNERKEAIKAALAEGAPDKEIEALKKIVRDAVIAGDVNTLTQFVEAANDTGRILGGSPQMKAIKASLAEVGVDASWTAEVKPFGQKPVASVLTLKLKDSQKEVRVRSDVGIVGLNRGAGEQKVDVGDTNYLKEISEAAARNAKALTPVEASLPGGSNNQGTAGKDLPETVIIEPPKPPADGRTGDTTIVPVAPNPVKPGGEAMPAKPAAPPTRKTGDTTIVPVSAQPSAEPPGPEDTVVLPGKPKVSPPGNEVKPTTATEHKPGDTVVLPAKPVAKPGDAGAKSNPADTTRGPTRAQPTVTDGGAGPGGGQPPRGPSPENPGPIPRPSDQPQPVGRADGPGTRLDTTAARDTAPRPTARPGAPAVQLNVGDQALVDKHWGYVAAKTSDGKTIVQLKSAHKSSTASMAQDADWYTPKNGYEPIQVDIRDGEGKSTGKQLLYYYKGDPRSAIDESRLIIVSHGMELNADDFKLSDASDVRPLKGKSATSEVARTTRRTDINFDTPSFAVDHHDVLMTYRTYADGVTIGTPDSATQRKYYAGNRDIRMYSADGGKTQIPLMRGNGWFYFGNRQSHAEGDAKFHITSTNSTDSGTVDRYIIPLLADALSKNPQTEEGKQLSKLVADAKMKDPLNRDERYLDRETDLDLKEQKLDRKTGELRYAENHVGERGQDSKHFTVYARTVEDARKAAKIVNEYLTKKAAEAPSLILDKNTQTGGLADGRRMEGSNRVSLARETWPFATIVDSNYQGRVATLSGQFLGASLEGDIGKQTRDYIKKNYGVTGDITQEHLDRLAREAGVKQGLLTFDQDGRLAAHADIWAQAKGSGNDSSYLSDGDVNKMTVDGEKQLTGRQAVYAIYELVNKGGTPDSRDPIYYVQEQERDTRRSFLETRPADIRTEAEFRNLQILRQSMLNNDMAEFRRGLSSIAAMPNSARAEAVLNLFAKEIRGLGFDCEVSRDWSSPTNAFNVELKTQGYNRALKLSSRPEVPPVMVTRDDSWKRVETPGAEADGKFNTYHEWLRQNIKYDHKTKPDTRSQEVKDFVDRMPEGFAPESTDYRLLQGLRELAIAGDTAELDRLMSDVNRLQAKDRINRILTEFQADAAKQGVKVEFVPIAKNGEKAAPVFTKTEAHSTSRTLTPTITSTATPTSTSTSTPTVRVETSRTPEAPAPSPKPEPNENPGERPKERVAFTPELARAVAQAPGEIRLGLHHIMASRRPDSARLIEDVLALHKDGKLPPRAEAFLSRQGAPTLADPDRMNSLASVIGEALGDTTRYTAGGATTVATAPEADRSSLRATTERHDTLRPLVDAKALPETQVFVGTTGRDGVSELTRVKLADLSAEQLDKRLSSLSEAEMKAELDTLRRTKRELLTDEGRRELDAKERALDTAYQMKAGYDKARANGTHGEYVNALHASLKPKSGASPAEIAKVNGVLGAVLILFNALPESAPRPTTGQRLKPGGS